MIQRARPFQPYFSGWVTRNPQYHGGAQEAISEKADRDQVREFRV
jgi:hypothetical protein